MNISSLSAHTPFSLSAYTPYINKVTSNLDAQMAATQQSIDGLHRLSASYDVKISDYGMIQSDLSNLQSAAQRLSGTDAFSSYRAKSTDSTTLTAYAQKSASPGTYSVDVSQLARGETLASAAQQNPSAAIGSGAPSTVTFQFVNGTKQSVSIDQSNNSLSGISASINQADIGISAAVAFNGTGFQLVLNGPSGSSNAFNVGVSGDDAVAGLLTYSNGATSSAMTQTMAAQDSQGSVNGKPFTGTSNVVTGADGGLMLNLSKAGHADVTVTTDTTQITGAVKSFVDAYNSAQSDLATSHSGDLSDDHTLPAISNRLSDDLKGGQSGSGMSNGSLGQIGIMRNQDGTLTFDTKAFQDAYSRNPAGVAHLFTDDGNGLADQVSSQLQEVLQPSGSISATVDHLQSKIQGNQQMEGDIEDNAINDLQHSAHEYAQQLSMMIVAQIVSQFMQSTSSQPSQAQAPTGISGIVLPSGMGAGSSYARGSGSTVATGSGSAMTTGSSSTAATGSGSVVTTGSGSAMATGSNNTIATGSSSAA